MSRSITDRNQESSWHRAQLAQCPGTPDPPQGTPSMKLLLTLLEHATAVAKGVTITVHIIWR